MFGLFGKRSPPQCPVPETSRQWLDRSFPFLIQRFGEEDIKHKKILVPHYTDFPIRYDGNESTAWDTLHILTGQMGVSSKDITLDIYEGERTGIGGNQTIYLGNYKNVNPTEMDISQKQEDGKYHIGIEKKFLTDPEGLVAWLAHDLARIRLTEHPQPEESKMLADLATVVFGIGVFNANASYREKQTLDSWGYQRVGYLKQREWGYALALFAQLREEKDPAWAKHLTPNIRSDFSKSQAYLEDKG